MRIWKKLLSVMLVLVMLVCSAPLDGFVDFDLFGFDASAGIISGTDENIWWTFDEETGELIVGGEGAIPRHNVDAYQWSGYFRKVKKIIIAYGITEIPDAAFWYFQNATEVLISGSVKKIGHTVFTFCNSLKIVYLPLSCTFLGINFTAGYGEESYCPVTDVYYEGSAEQFAAIENVLDGIHKMPHALRNVPNKHFNSSYDYYYPEGSGEEEPEKPEEPTKIFPEGYNPDWDRYAFPNINEPISSEIYKNAFGTVKGMWLHWCHENKDKHGHCYGMASTTAALLKHRNAIGQFYDQEDGYCSTITEILPTTKSFLFGSDAQTFIKYAHVYQFDSDEQQTRDITADDLEGLYEAIKMYVEDLGTPIVITVWQKDFWGFWKHGHAVLAVGLTEENGEYCILVDDSNRFYPFVLQKIYISKDFSEWRFQADGSSRKYGSENGVISYSSPADTVYQIGLLLNENKSEFLSADNNLIYSTGDITTEASLTEILPGTETTGDVNQKTDKLYWMEDDVKEISLEALEDDTEITISDINSSVKVELDKADTAEFYVEDASNSYVYFDTDVSDSVDIEFSSANEDGKITDITITGTASSSEITATQTDTGLVVTGIEDGTITLTQDDEVVATKRVTNATGDVEITYDANGETTDLDAEYPHECNDYNHNGKCDICTETLEAVKNCDCMCHKSGFMALVYAFVNLFWRLFGMHKSCECGVWHW